MCAFTIWALHNTWFRIYGKLTIRLLDKCTVLIYRYSQYLWILIYTVKFDSNWRQKVLLFLLWAQNSKTDRAHSLKEVSISITVTKKMQKQIRYHGHVVICEIVVPKVYNKAFWKMVSFGRVGHPCSLNQFNQIYWHFCYWHV